MNIQIKARHILLVLTLFVSLHLHAQDKRAEFNILFRAGYGIIERNVGDNAKSLDELNDFIDRFVQDSTLAISEVHFYGTASPEGSYQLNYKLARKRMAALERYINKRYPLTEATIARDENYIPWDYLKEQVSQDKEDIVGKDAVLKILDKDAELVDYMTSHHIDHRILQLQYLNRGFVWRYLFTRYFDKMRGARVVFTYYRKEFQPLVEPWMEPSVIAALPEPQFSSFKKAETPAESEEVPIVSDWNRYFYVKTNALGWGLAITNFGVEIDITKHLSLSIPVLYSAHNFFVQDIKFRTLAVQPELRYWPRSDNQGFFVGAHFGYAQYNIAVDGQLRYQDHRGKSPALGGGIGIGYRMPMSKNQRWHVEFALGAGVYKLHYDTFYNVKNGKYVGTYRKTYWGIDNAAVNISYRFNLKKNHKR